MMNPQGHPKPDSDLNWWIKQRFRKRSKRLEPTRFHQPTERSMDIPLLIFCFGASVSLITNNEIGMVDKMEKLSIENGILPSFCLAWLEDGVLAWFSLWYEHFPTYKCNKDENLPSMKSLWLVVIESNYPHSNCVCAYC
ncbi:hypothetical protein YC2023_002023 [Brassica napus]